MANQLVLFFIYKANLLLEVIESLDILLLNLSGRCFHGSHSNKLFRLTSAKLIYLSLSSRPFQWFWRLNAFFRLGKNTSLISVCTLLLWQFGGRLCLNHCFIWNGNIFYRIKIRFRRIEYLFYGFYWSTWFASLRKLSLCIWSRFNTTSFWGFTC